MSTTPSPRPVIGLPYARVSGVLLDDGSDWRVVANASFSVDVLEARGGCIVRHTPACGEQCTAGFAFATEDDVIVSGPLDRVLAVRDSSLTEGETR